MTEFRQQRIRSLAAQKAEFTKQLNAFHKTDDPDKREIAAGKMAAIIDRAPQLGFTQDEVTQRAEIPCNVTVFTGRLIPLTELPNSVQDDPDLILSQVEGMVDTTDRHIYGSGTESVYAYGYRCAPDRLKVGYTKFDVLQRIAQQIYTSTPDKPMLSLVIQTNNGRGLEKALHSILDVRGRKVTGGGDEWFLTTRNELIAMYTSIIGPANT